MVNDNIVIPRAELPDPDQVEGFFKMHEVPDEVDSKHFYDVALYYLAIAVKLKEEGR